MRSLWAAAFLLRRLRSELGVVLLIVALVAVTSFLFAAAPRLFNQVADEGLRHELRGAGPVQRNLQLSTVSTIVSGEDPFGALLTLGDRYEERFPASVRELIAERSVGFTSIRFGVVDPPEYTTFIALRYQSGLEDAIELTDGRMPVRTAEPLPQASFGLAPSDEEPPEVPPLVEIALSDASAEEIGVAVGDVLEVRADGSDPLLRRSFERPLEARFAVVGIFRVTDAGAEVWYAERALQTVNRGGSDDNPIAFATGLVSPEAYPDLITSALPFRYHWRYLVDAERLDGGRLDALVPDLRRLETQFDTSATDAAANAGVVLRTGLPALIAAYLAQRASSEAVLSVAAIGPGALAAGAIGMLGVLLVSRRRPNLELARGRGASGSLLLGAQLWEGLLLAGSAALLGWLVAVTVIPGRDSFVSTALGVTVGLASTAVLVAATWPLARRPLGQLGRDDPPVLAVSPRRLVLEGTAVLLAVGGALLLRQRGLQIEGEALVRFDPFLAAVPVLAGMAVGIVAMRLYPVPVRALGWLAARRRDLVPVLGLRSVGRHPAAASLPLLVLMLTAAFGSFASVVTASVDRGQVDASWREVGADYRLETITGAGVSPRVDPGAVPGVHAVARGMVDSLAPFASTANQRSTIYLHAIEPAAYAEVTADGPLRPAWPAAFLQPPVSAGLGTPENPIPAIVSRRLPVGSVTLNPGALFELTVRGQAMTLRVAEVRNTHPGIPVGIAFVVAPFDQLATAYANPPLLPSALFMAGPAEIEEQLVATLREQSVSVLITSRHTRYAALQDAPLVAAIAIGFRLALLAAAGYTALAVIVALTLSAARRTRDLAFLKTLGLSARQSLGLTVVEHGPPVLLALIPGVALGIGVAFLLGPGLGLSSFVGSEVAVTLRVDWPALAAVSIGLVLVVTLAIAFSTWISRRARAVDALRIGDD